MTVTRYWGQAGVRLTDEQIRAKRAEAGRRRAARVADEEVAHKLWRAGMLRPYMITMVLDKEGLDGPEVDIACGAREPDVDLWEAGKLYPTWEQVLLLCELTRTLPRFLCGDHEPLPVAATSMRFHEPHYDEPPLVRAFEPQAIAAAVTPHPITPDTGEATK